MNIPLIMMIQRIVMTIIILTTVCNQDGPKPTYNNQQFINFQIITISLLNGSTEPFLLFSQNLPHLFQCQSQRLYKFSTIYLVLVIFTVLIDPYISHGRSLTLTEFYKLSNFSEASYLFYFRIIQPPQEPNDHLDFPHNFHHHHHSHHPLYHPYLKIFKVTTIVTHLTKVVIIVMII